MTQTIIRSLGSIDGAAGDDVQITRVVLTHGHDDHTGAAAALVEASGA